MPAAHYSAEELDHLIVSNEQIERKFGFVTPV